MGFSVSYLRLGWADIIIARVQLVSFGEDLLHARLCRALRLMCYPRFAYTSPLFNAQACQLLFLSFDVGDETNGLDNQSVPP